jgi:hypothetical protein
VFEANPQASLLPRLTPVCDSYQISLGFCDKTSLAGCICSAHVTHIRNKLYASHHACMHAERKGVRTLRSKGASSARKVQVNRKTGSPTEEQQQERTEPCRLQKQPRSLTRPPVRSAVPTARNNPDASPGPTCRRASPELLMQKSARPAN